MAMNHKTKALFKKLYKKFHYLKKVAEDKKEVPFDDNGKVNLPTSLESFRKWSDEKLGFESISKDGLYHKTRIRNGRAIDTPSIKAKRDELEGVGQFEGKGIFEKIRHLKDGTGDRKREFKRVLRRAKDAESKVRNLTSELANLRMMYNEIKKDLILARQVNKAISKPTNIKNIIPIDGGKN